MHNVHGLVISVDRETLLAKLQVNREEHIRVYNDAVSNYREMCITLLRDKLEHVSSDSKKVRPDKFLHFSIPCPQSYVEVYDHVIGMLKFSADNQIKITADQYYNWVEDKWDWTRAWEASSAPYTMP